MLMLIFDFVQKVRTTMKYPHSIPLCYTNGEPFPGGNPSRVVVSSGGTKWNDVVGEQHHFPSSKLADVIYKRHAICINIGHSFTWEFEKDGRFQRVQRARGAISFFPSHQPFSGRLTAERGVFANFLLLALNPVFVSRVAKGLEFDADRIELTEQRGITDLALRHIALALRAGIQTGDALGGMYGEALSTALAVHLLREYGAAVLRAEEAIWQIAARKAGARGRIYSRSTECRLNCFRDCSRGLHDTLSLYQAVQRVYRQIALPVCRRGQGKKSERTSDYGQVHHQRSCTPCRFRRSDPSYTSFQKSFRLTS